MNNEIKRHVIKLLENYSKTQNKITLLRYEQEHPPQISPDEMISAMAFARGEGEGRPIGQISNKTLYIAMNYHNAATKLNCDVMDDISNRLSPLQHDANRLDFYFKLLCETQQRVIQLYYFEKKSLQIVADQMGISVWSVRRIRDKAVELLCEMYAFIDSSDH